MVKQITIHYCRILKRMIMKYINIILVCVVMVLTPMWLTAQTGIKMNFKAIVRGAKGLPVQNAVIRSEADNTSALTDSTGTFIISVTSGTTVSISAPGAETKLITAGPEPDQ